MIILMDTREKAALTFEIIAGVSVKSEKLDAGDYACRHTDGTMDDTVFERKSVADLFHSFTHEYPNERAKIERAKSSGFKYVLAIEAPAIEVKRGHHYWKGGRLHEVKKDGLTQVRQIMTIQRKYGIEVWWCASRTDMAFRIQEYYLAKERIDDERRRERQKEVETIKKAA